MSSFDIVFIAVVLDIKSMFIHGMRVVRNETGDLNVRMSNFSDVMLDVGRVLLSDLMGESSLLSGLLAL